MFALLVLYSLIIEKKKKEKKKRQGEKRKGKRKKKKKKRKKKRKETVRFLGWLFFFQVAMIQKKCCQEVVKDFM